MKTRDALEKAFANGAKPSGSDFTDLIVTMLSQQDDGIAKSSGDPLKIAAAGADQSLINFYPPGGMDKDPSWQVKQGVGSGLSIREGAGTSPPGLFIQSGTGNVGIGTTAPQATVQVRDFGESDAYLKITVAGGNRFCAGLKLETRQHNNGYWIEYDEKNSPAAGLKFTNASISNDAKVVTRTDLFVNGANGNVGIGTVTPPSEKLEVAGNVKATALHSTGGMMIDGKNTLESGGGVQGKEGNAGKIGYQVWSDALDIVGAGTYQNNRKIKLWAEGGLEVTGSVCQRMDVIEAGNSNLDDGNNQVRQYFINNLTGKEAGTIIMAVAKMSNPQSNDWDEWVFIGWMSPRGRRRLAYVGSQKDW